MLQVYDPMSLRSLIERCIIVSENFSFLSSPYANINLIRDNLRDRYRDGFPVVKELVRNADDAGATHLDIGWTHGLPKASHPLLQGPALFIINERILGVGHKVMDLALEQSLALEESVTSIPDSMLQRPVVLFRVTDQVTGQGGAVRSVIVGIEGNSPARVLRDWEVVEHLNALSERLGRQKWAKDSAPASNISDVRNALEQARRVAHEHVAYLDLPFKMPSVDVLTVLWPVSAHETGSNLATDTET